jgi:hypothetical protein
MPVILATWEEVIVSITIWAQFRQKVLKTPSQPMAESGGFVIPAKQQK